VALANGVPLIVDDPVFWMVPAERVCPEVTILDEPVTAIDGVPVEFEYRPAPFTVIFDEPVIDAAVTVVSVRHIPHGSVEGTCATEGCDDVTTKPATNAPTVTIATRWRNQPCLVALAKVVGSLTFNLDSILFWIHSVKVRVRITSLPFLTCCFRAIAHQRLLMRSQLPGIHHVGW
jgi:hypothetical protein